MLLEINHQIALLRGFWGLIEQRQKVYCICIIFLMMISSIAEAVSIGAVIPFLAVLADPQKIIEVPILGLTSKFLNFNTSDNNLTLVVTFIFVAAVIIAALLRLLLLWCVVKVSFLIGSSMSVKMFQIALFQDYETHISENSSAIISGITTKVDSIIFGAFMPCMLLLSSFGMLFGIIGTLLFFNAILTISIFSLFIAIYIAVIFFVKNKIIGYSIDISQGSDNLIRVLQEAFGGIRDVIMGGLQKYYIDIYTKENLRLKKSQGSCNFIGQSPRYFIEALGIASIAIAAYFMSKKESGLIDLLPMLGAIAFATQKLLPIFQQGYAAFVSLQSNQASLYDALSLLKRPIFLLNNVSSNLVEKKFLKEIRLIDLAFSYRKSNNFIFSNIDLVIPKGSRVGIIGSSGGGKSTFLDLVMGLLKPSAGMLTVDGVSTHLRGESWRKCISHIPQNVFLVDGTILENIALGVPKYLVNMNQLNMCIEISQLKKLILNIDGGYNAKIGENGGRLSGGQRQRIGIARALYMDSDVLVMDEATSALDLVTERKIMNSIYELDKEKTIFIATHKTEILKQCDMILEIGDGRIRKIPYSEIQIEHK
jgi:ATP-binding cassette, subfamily B, bacterial PglK